MYLIGQGQAGRVGVSEDLESLKTLSEEERLATMTKSGCRWVQMAHALFSRLTCLLLYIYSLLYIDFWMGKCHELQGRFQTRSRICWGGPMVACDPVRSSS